MKEPKLKTVYVCSNCGETSPRWMGRCPSCGSWNTMNEDVVAETPKAGLSGGKSAAPARQEGVTSLTAKRLADISTLIIIVDIIQPHHLVSPFQQTLHDIRPDKPGCAGDQYFHKIYFSNIIEEYQIISPIYSIFQPIHVPQEYYPL